MNKTDTIARMRRDGTVVEVLPDGTERQFPTTPMRSMTDEEVHTAALKDPDARPMTDEKFQRAQGAARQDAAARARPYAGRVRCALSHPDWHIARLGTGALGTRSASAGLSHRDRARPGRRASRLGG